MVAGPGFEPRDLLLKTFSTGMAANRPRLTFSFMPLLDRFSSAKCEAEDFSAAIEELDLKTAVLDRSRLTDQLIHPLLHDRAVSVRVDIGSVGRPGTLTNEQDAKPHHRAFFRRSHHQVHIARVELVSDQSLRTVERAGV